MQPHASRQDWRAAVAGLQFPTSRAAVVNRAVDHGGLDREVKLIVERLPDAVYRSAAELAVAIRATYTASGVVGELPI